MQALRFLLLVWLSVTFAGGLAALSPLRLYSLKVLLAFGMIVHDLPFAMLVICAMVIHALAFCYVWKTRPA